ncbi:MAG TPA: hypothetical protein VMT00_08800 [Thermoanaerobaculia bacterium]|nr:hypothetical protein [Thermoanaerobaculia bacterium]
MRALFFFAFLVMPAVAGAHVGFGIDVADDGSILCRDAGADRIVRIDRSGKVTTIVTGVHGNLVRAGDDGSIYYNDHERIWMRLADGSLRPLRVPDKMLKQRREPMDLDRQGHSYWSLPGAIVRVGPGGDVATVVATPLLPQMASGAAGAGGAYYGKTAAGLAKINAQGEVTILSRGRASQQRRGVDSEVSRERVVSLDVDAEERVWIAVYRDRSLHRIDGDRSEKSVYRPRWPWTPIGVVSTASGPVVLERFGDPYKIPPLPAFTGATLRVTILRSTPGGELVPVRRIEIPR